MCHGNGWMMGMHFFWWICWILLIVVLAALALRRRRPWNSSNAVMPSGRSQPRSLKSERSM